MISNVEMEKELVVLMVMVMLVAAAILSGGVIIEQAGEAAAKTAEEGLGDIARKAVHKADKILNGSSKCKLCSSSDLPYLIFLSLFAYFASACY